MQGRDLCCALHTQAARAKDEHRSLQAGEQRAKWAEIGDKILFRALQEAWEQGLKVSGERVVQHGLKEMTNLIKSFKKSGCRTRD